MLTINRYGRRNWAVYLNGTLLVVAVYKKGANAVKNTLESAFAIALAGQPSGDVLSAVNGFFW